MGTLTGVRRVTLLTLPATLSAVALALSGCGADGPHPGTAIAVGDQTVTTRHVDDVATRYCDALTKAANGTVVPLRSLRSQVVSALTARAIAKAYATSHDVEPDDSYARTLAQLRQQIASYDAPTREAITDVEAAQAYVDAVGKAAGGDALTTWLRKERVRLNPVYGVKVDGGRMVPVDPSLSVAVSDTAKADRAGSSGAASSATGSSATGSGRTCGA